MPRLIFRRLFVLAQEWSQLHQIAPALADGRRREQVHLDASVPVSPDVADKRPAASIASPCCVSSSRKRTAGEHVTFWVWYRAQSTPLDEIRDTKSNLKTASLSSVR